MVNAAQFVAAKRQNKTTQHNFSVHQWGNSKSTAVKSYYRIEVW